MHTGCPQNRFIKFEGVEWMWSEVATTSINFPLTRIAEKKKSLTIRLIPKPLENELCVASIFILDPLSTLRQER